MAELRYPSFTAVTEREQQLKSYLYQLIGDLQFAFDNIGNANGGGSSASNDELVKRLAEQYVPKSSFNTFSNKVEKSLSDLHGSEWVSLGVSDYLHDPEIGEDTYGTAECKYRTVAGGVQVYFNCSLYYGGGWIKVNENAIPTEHRPTTNAYAICAVNGTALAKVLVDTSGNVFIEWVQELATNDITSGIDVKWIDAHIDYFI